MNRFMKPFDDTHVFRMTDDTGMFQHARYGVPDLFEGYTTDDNARALIMAVMLYEKLQKPAYLALVYRYLAFVLYAQNETGQFRLMADHLLRLLPHTRQNRIILAKAYDVFAKTGMGLLLRHKFLLSYDLIA